MKQKQILLIIAIMLTMPLLRAQDYSVFLKEAQEWLDKGECEKARMSYDDYKEFVGADPTIEQRIDSCLKVKENEMVGETDKLVIHKVGELCFYIYKPGKGMTWDMANTAASTSTEAGRSDWRLPDKRELEIILQYIHLNTDPTTSGLEYEIYYWASKSGSYRTSINYNAIQLNKDGTVNKIESADSNQSYRCIVVSGNIYK